MPRTSSLQVETVVINVNQCQSMIMVNVYAHCSIFIWISSSIYRSPFSGSNNCFFSEISCVSGQKSERNNLEISRTDVCNPREGHCWLFCVCELLEFGNKDKLKTKVYHNCDL